MFPNSGATDSQIAAQGFTGNPALTMFLEEIQQAFFGLGTAAFHKKFFPFFEDKRGP
jgi:hypothetical protein